MISFKKDVKSCSKSILQGDMYQCFDSESLSLFLSCIYSACDDNILCHQCESLFILSWFLPCVPVKQLLNLRSDHIRIYRNRIEVSLPDRKRIIIPVDRDGPVYVFARRLWDYLHMLCSFEGSCFLFPSVRSQYVANGYSDLTRKLRYHLPRWLNRYNDSIDC